MRCYLVATAKRDLPAIDDLINQVEAAAARELPDMLEGLVTGIKHCIQAQTDSYLVAGSAWCYRAEQQH